MFVLAILEISGFEFSDKSTQFMGNKPSWRLAGLLSEQAPWAPERSCTTERAAACLKVA